MFGAEKAEERQPKVSLLHFLFCKKMCSAAKKQEIFIGEALLC